MLAVANLMPLHRDGTPNRFQYGLEEKISNTQYVLLTLFHYLIYKNVEKKEKNLPKLNSWHTSISTSPFHLTATNTLMLLEPRLVLENIKSTPDKQEMAP